MYEVQEHGRAISRLLSHEVAISYTICYSDLVLTVSGAAVNTNSATYAVLSGSHVLVLSEMKTTLLVRYLPHQPLCFFFMRVFLLLLLLLHPTYTLGSKSMVPLVETAVPLGFLM